MMVDGEHRVTRAEQVTMSREELDGLKTYAALALSAGGTVEHDVVSGDVVIRKPASA